MGTKSTVDSRQSTITINKPGKYWLEVSDDINCRNTDTITVNSDQRPVVSLGKDTSICTGHSLTLDAGNPGMSYIWNTGASSETISVSSQGEYMVTVVNGKCKGQEI